MKHIKIKVKSPSFDYFLNKYNENTNSNEPVIFEMTNGLSALCKRKLTFKGGGVVKTNYLHIQVFLGGDMNKTITWIKQTSKGIIQTYENKLIVKRYIEELKDKQL